MTDDEAKDLGLRALAAGFRWAPGVRLGDADETCRLTFAWYIGDDDDEGATPVLHPAGDGIGPGWGWPADGSGWWPDFRDAATMGVLVAQVREAWDPRRGSGYLASTMHTGSGWGVGARFGSEGLATIVECVHETEAHALVAALEACAEA